MCTLPDILSHEVYFYRTKGIAIRRASADVHPAIYFRERMPTYIICIEPSHIHISIKILIFNALSRERGGLVGTVPTKGRVDDDDE